MAQVAVRRPFGELICATSSGLSQRQFFISSLVQGPLRAFFQADLAKGQVSILKPVNLLAAARPFFRSPPTDAAMTANLIYKIEGDYIVYVQPVWYEMPFDWKRGAAAYIAECKLGGSARFLDARSRKLVALGIERVCELRGKLTLR
jgi:hypothetical protein